MLFSMSLVIRYYCMDARGVQSPSGVLWRGSDLRRVPTVLVTDYSCIQEFDVLASAWVASSNVPTDPMLTSHIFLISMIAQWSPEFRKNDS
jgi:hypothetical protein